MTATRHDLDAHAWATETTALIRAGRLDEVDFEHVAEELESMGAAERNALNNRMTELLLPLLKWRFQAERRGASWEVSIIKQRNAIADLLDTSPSLRPRLPETLAKTWPRAPAGGRRNPAAGRHLPGCLPVRTRRRARRRVLAGPGRLTESRSPAP